MLLVEDNEGAIVQMLEILRDQGYEVDLARDGAAALEIVSRALPDAMILDLMMPGVDGFEVLGKLREDPRTVRLPVLILTAKHVSKEELSILKGNHIHQLIQKGDVDAVRLLSAVAEMVAHVAVSDGDLPPRAMRRRKPAANAKPLVLVVEDNPDNLQTARALLEPMYAVVEAKDGLEGLAEARKRLPDVILMDIALPGLDGVQTLRQLRQDPAIRDIPVIAVTASAMSSDKERILAHDFDGYVSKPIDHEEFLKTIRDVLGE